MKFSTKITLFNWVQQHNLYNKFCTCIITLVTPSLNKESFAQFNAETFCLHTFDYIYIALTFMPGRSLTFYVTCGSANPRPACHSQLFPAPPPSFWYRGEMSISALEYHTFWLKLLCNVICIKLVHREVLNKFFEF